jgi:LPS-assembly protein
VRINRAGNVYEGSELQLQVDAFEGFFNERATVAGQRRAWRGRAWISSDRDRAVVHEATYTTCARGPGRLAARLDPAER